MNNKDVAGIFIDAGILAESEAVDYVVDKGIDAVLLSEKLMSAGKFFLTREVIEALDREDKIKDIGNVVEVKAASKKIIAKDIAGSVKVHSKAEEPQNTKTLTDFVAYFNDRYEKIKNIILAHTEVKNTMSIGRLNEATDEKNVCVIAIISDINISKNGHHILNIEDPTGTMTAIIMKDKNIGEDTIIPDEIIAVFGSVSNGTMFVNSMVFPDVPVMNSYDKRIEDDVSAVLISDIHMGSNEYLQKVEDRFIKWLKSGDDSAGKVKYICISGDNVDGVGIYPGQKQDLKIVDIYNQYLAFEKFIERIPEYIEIVIIPGNHDAVRLAEPQPSIGKNYFPNITSFKNVHLGPNPCRVELHAMNGRVGVDVLMYHGYSFTKIINAIPSLRVKGMDQPEYVMTELLRKRHLAPMYKSTQLMPSGDDPHVIKSVPDIFQTGDLHSFAVKTYRGVLMVSASTFQGQTSFMDRVGHESNPGKVTVVSLKDKRPKVLDLLN